MKIRKMAALCIASVLMAISLFPINAYAEDQDKVIVEAVGFFSHFPMRPTRQVIEETCAKFGDQVQLTLYDETKAAGQEFLASKGLSGHIPMRLYINGVNTLAIDGQEISFSDFVDDAWTAADLEKAITLALEGGVEAVSVDKPAESSGSRAYILIIGISAGIVIIALAGFLLFKPKKKAKGRS